jgi:branched-subunit amino acid transport protein
MSTLEIWLTIVAMAVTVLLTRAGMLFLPERVRLPPRVQRALRYAGPCVLVAIVVPDLLRHDGHVDLGFDNIRLMASLVAIVVCLVTRSALLTIVFGLLALTALRLLT